MFKIIEGDFKNNKYSNEEYLDNWPMLYILENGKKAYIGESNHVKTRMTQHTTNEEKRIFNKVHFIYSRLFNQSVTFDYESKLIQYIVADELFQVTNKNSGIADKQYYEKEKYDEKELGKFASEGKDKLWLQKSHYYDVSLRSVFYCGYRYAICQYDALCTKCYCCRPGGENLQDKC